MKKVEKLMTLCRSFKSQINQSRAKKAASNAGRLSDGVEEIFLVKQLFFLFTLVIYERGTITCWARVKELLLICLREVIFSHHEIQPHLETE